MTALPYTFAADPRPKLGLIVLQADETIEDDFRALFSPSDVRLHVSRLPSGAALTPASIHQMKSAITAAASLFPEGLEFDAVGFACTSATALIGADEVGRLVQAGCETQHVTNPLSAAFAELDRVGARRIGVLSPYTEDIAADLCRSFEMAGYQVPDSRTFGEEVEANVARIAPGAILQGARDILAAERVDAVFLSCTNLRTLSVIRQLQTETAVPILSSNLALGHHMARLAGGRPPEL